MEMLASKIKQLLFYYKMSTMNSRYWPATSFPGPFPRFENTLGTRSDLYFKKEKIKVMSSSSMTSRKPALTL